MNPRQFKSAVMRLAVPYDPNPAFDSKRIVEAHPLAQLYIAASHAFELAGAAGFYWFRKQPVDAIDEDRARMEFIRWLSAASDQEIDDFILAMSVYRKALADEAASDPPRMGPREAGGVLSGESGRIAWSKINKLAGFAAAETQSRERSAKGGKDGAKKRTEEREQVKSEVLRLAKNLQPQPPSPLEAARRIWKQLLDDEKLARSHGRIYKLLGELIRDGKISFDTKGVRVKKQGSR
jgi:hypothetical protein